MAKYLKDITIQLKYNKKLIDLEAVRKFNRTTQIVQNIFWYLIPKRFEFGDMMKLIIEICLNEDEYEPPTNFSGYVTYNFVGFNFEEYFNLTRIEQNELILNVLREIICEIPVKDDENKRIALELTNQIEEMKFDYRQTSKKLSKSHKSRKFRANIVYKVNDNGQNAYLEVIDKEGNVLVDEFLITNNIYEFKNSLNKTRWQEDTFQIIDKKGEIFREFKLEKNVLATISR